MSPLIITLVILIGVFVALLSGKVSYGIIGGAIVVLLMLTNVLTPAEALSGFSNTNVVIMFCMMAISAGLMKTSLIEHILGLVGKVGKSERALVAGFGLIAAAMAQFMSAFVAVACLLPFITGMCKELGIKRTKVIYPIIIIALTFVSWLPVGTAVANNFAQPNGYLENYGSAVRFSMFDMTIARLPGVVLTTIFAIFILPKICPEKSSIDTRDDLGKEIQKSTLEPWREKAAYAITAGTMGLMILSSTLGIDTCLIACGGTLLMVLFGILDDAQVIASVNWGMLFLFAGVLPLATALTKTGASELIVDFILKIIGGSTNPWIISIVFVVMSFIVAQFLASIPCIQVLMPLVLMVCVQLNMSPIGALSLVNIGATAVYLTPMANPGIPMCMATGGYSAKDCIKIGILPGILVCTVGVIWCSLFFPAY